MPKVFLLKSIITIFTICYSLAANAAEPIRIFTSIAPQKYFVQQIGKELVSVKVMVPPGGSPATYEPKPRQIADISKTSLYFAIGVPFENVWLEKIAAANPAMKIIHTDRGIKKIPMAAYHHHSRGGGHPGKNENNPHVTDDSGRDPHIWLSPHLVKIQAATILAALQEVDPNRRNVYEDNYRQFIATLDQLDAHLKSIFGDQPGGRFMVFHPSWGYFANDYGLEQVPIEIEGKNPKACPVEGTDRTRQGKGHKSDFCPTSVFRPKAPNMIAKEIGGQVVFADPLAEDWLTNLSEVAEKFEAALK